MSSVSPPEVDQKRSRAGITVPMLFVLGGLTAVPPLTFDAYLPALPQVAADLGVPEAQIQLTLSACLLGIAFGQLFGGPVSDARGRRTPLLVGVLGYTFFSLACAVAPSAPALVGLRFGQGLLGGVAVVIARAIVRDRAEGAAAARVFSLLMLVGGLAPILAPLVGSALIEVTTWRGIFVFLAGLGAIGLVAVMKVLPETLAPADRHTGGIRDTLAVAGRVVRDRDVMGFVLTSAFASGALFFYISSSSFVFQDVYDLSPTAFSLIFRDERDRADGDGMGQRHARPAPRSSPPPHLGRRPARVGRHRPLRRAVGGMGLARGLAVSHGRRDQPSAHHPERDSVGTRPVRA